MINRKTVIASGALATDLAKKGLVLKPIENTVLSQLYEAINASDVLSYIHDPERFSATTDLSDDAQFFEHYATYFESLSSGGDVPSRHDVLSDSFINDIGKSVINHISFAKNIVKPVVMDYTEAVQKTLNVIPAITPYSDFLIDIVDIPDVIFEKRFYSDLKQYGSKVPVKPNNKLSLESKSNDDIIDLLMFGDEIIDNMIRAWALQINEKNPGFFYNIWHSFFGDTVVVHDAPETAYFYRYDDLLKINVIERSDYLLAIYLIANRLFNTVDESAKGLSINAYLDNLAIVRDYSATLLYQSVEQAENYQKTMMIVMETDPMKKTCKVYGTTYKQWLDKNGSPELIYAVMLSGNRYYSQAMIDEHADTLKKTWDSYVVFHSTTTANLWFERFKKILRHEFAEIMTGFSEEELAYSQYDTNYLEKAKALFEKELDAIRMEDKEDIYKTALKLICRSRFFYTDAESILTDINNAKLINPNLTDVREAALIATIHYVVDYIADQIMMVKQ